MPKVHFNTFLLKVSIVTTLAIVSYSSLYAFSAQICYYVIKKGASKDFCSWHLEKSNHYINTIETKDTQNTTIVQKGFDTIEWQLKSSKQHTDIKAVKKGETIDLEGEFLGQAVKKTISIDNCPWFQSISVSLKPVASSGISKIYFWFIRSDNLKAHKMVATKKELQDLRLDGYAFKARRVEIRPYGLLACFWKGECWFSEEGMFLKYRGLGWPPGSPDTEIEYRKAVPDIAYTEKQYTIN